MAMFRARVVTDLVYEADKPMPASKLRKVAQNTDTYLHVAAHEGIDNIKVHFDDRYRYRSAHHHDGIHGCRRCNGMTHDQLTGE